MVAFQKPRNDASIAVALLEVIRAQDRPTEILADEDPTQTLPRKLGLSGVVETQIRRYREDVRNRIRLTDSELKDLFGLVIRRPDSEDVFALAGSRLGDQDGRVPAGGALPRVVVNFRARRGFRKTLKRLFGRRMGGFAPGDFVFEGAGLFFVQADPGGDACHMVSGLAESILVRHMGGGVRVTHTLCQARGDSTCRWVGEPSGMEPPPHLDHDADDHAD
jgi:hypothetical protein